jgi:uncharacterized membrane protein
MSELIVLVFEDEHQAPEALAALRRMEKEGALHFEDTAVIVKDQNGKVHKKNEVSSTTETGVVGGALLGVLLTFLFPGVGLLIGGLAGGAIGALLGEGVDGKFVKDLSQSMQPGTSALFVLIKHAQPAVIDVLKPFHGKVYQTTLNEDLEERLERALA